MRYSIEMHFKGSTPVILLQTQEDNWLPTLDQVEIPAEEVVRFVDVQMLSEHWRWVEYLPNRSFYVFESLRSLLMMADRDDLPVTEARYIGPHIS